MKTRPIDDFLDDGLLELLGNSHGTNSRVSKVLVGHQLLVFPFQFEAIRPCRDGLLKDSGQFPRCFFVRFRGFFWHLVPRVSRPAFSPAFLV